MNWLMCAGDSVTGPVGWLWEKRFDTWLKYENHAGKKGKYRLTFSKHIFEDNIDAAVVGVVVAFLLHSSGQFLVSRLAQMCMINDA